MISKILKAGNVETLVFCTVLSVFAAWSFGAAFFGDHWVLQLHGALIGLFCSGVILCLFLKRDSWKGKDHYNFDIVRLGIYIILFWAIVAFIAGVYIAVQLWLPQLNLDMAQTTFGRLKPIHTSGVVFAFAGNVMIFSSFYVVQKTCGVRLQGGFIPWFIVFAYQLFVVLAAIGYLFGVTQSKEYAEPEWYLDIFLTFVWVLYLYVFLKTLLKRKENHIYVSNWFYLSFIITMGLLHLLNNVALPMSLFSVKSYIAFSGVQDAMIQWWYGHNAVGFLLTVGFVGMVYYFLPKASNLPIFSYRLSVVHFWGLIFLYMWAGPHHLHYTPLPLWVQNLGMTFSLILWMPSWGGAFNGMMTLHGGHWHLLKSNISVRFSFTSLVYYAIATFEGPLLSIGPVNALGHYTDWIVSHVHVGGIGWVAMVSFGALYYMIPALWGGRMYSNRLSSLHYWLAMIGLNSYIVSMWIAGIWQGLLLKAHDEYGILTYSFIETLEAIQPFHVIRSLGGGLFLLGVIIMAYNFLRTVAAHRAKKAAAMEDSHLSKPALEGGRAG